MGISNLDMKTLWGRAGGRCSHLECDEDLTTLIATGNYTVGEMAHIIGNKPTAARGTPDGGADTYDNLILLCPTHHRHIDKSPEGTYTIEMLHDWKKQQEDMIRSAGKNIRFNNFEELRLAISRILISNKMLFDKFGPLSTIADEDPSSNAYLIWELKRVDTLLPNNRKILNLIDSNEQLIEDVSLFKLVEEFRLHVESYEKHVYHRLDSYLLFPKKFAEVF